MPKVKKLMISCTDYREEMSKTITMLCLWIISLTASITYFLISLFVLSPKFIIAGAISICATILIPQFFDFKKPARIIDDFHSQFTSRILNKCGPKIYDDIMYDRIEMDDIKKH